MAVEKPNILVLWGDDIGWWNISYNSRGQMGYRTPNIDRIANEGVAFTDYYGQQSCTAGRAAFITGQNPIRTGLTKVGMPGADLGLQAEDPTIAELLKPHGYATGQFGKNHLGDRDEFLPTNHGFDEFFGNLYHLNAEEEPEDPDYPQGSGVQEALWPARRDPQLRGRSHRGHGAAHEEAHGDDRRRGHRTGSALHGRGAPGGEALLPLVQHDRHALPHPPRREAQGQERAGRLQRRDGRSRREHRPHARQARRAGYRRQHHRHVLHRQRPPLQQLAGCRHHAVPI